MHFTSFIPAAALFLLSYTSAVNAAHDDAHQLVARSSTLVMRQVSGDLGTCESKCTPVESKLTSCGADAKCLCSSAMSVPFHDCAECAYGLVTDASTKSQLISAYNQYVDACKQAGSPVSGDTTLGDGPSTSSKSNDAASLSSGLAVGFGLPAAAIAASALFL
ncbi:hypothetical protein M407DRAFT_28819 [Tulasnella calospora MUT 4182]|uniref:Extracellular membrane protein CFEM domain-containing protein n=1 Tax=Tulasnella calospora MUT 4182 TaxID=1051891 RepID=A0A0C3Q0Q5_9AGAM|nr:hypothetical protein M407DRAFT_28819 [Tulasnella calospora MUT 4182]